MRPHAIGTRCRHDGCKRGGDPDDTRGHDNRDLRRDRGRARRDRSDERDVRDGRQRSDPPIRPCKRYPKSCSYDGGIELRTRGVDQLPSSDRDRIRLLVRPRRRHHRKRVSDCDDSRRDRHFLAAQPVRIAGPVPALVMLAGGGVCITEPPPQRLEHLRACARVSLQDRPLLFRRSARFVEDRRRHTHLSDIVQQRAPPQPVERRAADPHLLGDHLAERPHPFRMTPRLAVVPIECRHHCKRGGEGTVDIGWQRQQRWRQ